MGKYLKLFETHSEYNTYISGNDKVLPNVSYCEDNNEVHYNPYISPNRIITYTASSKLTERDGEPSWQNSGLYINSFNVTIVSHTFENGVGTIQFDGDVTSIGNYAFFNCSNLISINIPNSVTSIGNSVFNGCSSLTNINIPSGVTSIGNSVFNGCSSLTNINIPSGVTSIGDNAFYWCSGLTSINIPSGVTSIGNNAFCDCRGLTSVTISNSVTMINAQVFRNCRSLTSITIPSGVTSIANYAFYGCSGLTSVTVLSTTPPTFGSDAYSAFDGTNNCPIYVPSESLSAFQSASGWSGIYGSRIQAIPTT